jgi:hypothetical protein
MSSSSYGPALRGTRTLTDTLGLIEVEEGYGSSNRTLGQVYGDGDKSVGSQHEGNPTIGYGFNLNAERVKRFETPGFISLRCK